MNEFDSGFSIGRVFLSWTINDLFCGFAFRVGKEKDINVNHLTIQIGYGMLTVGIKR